MPHIKHITYIKSITFPSKYENIIINNFQYYLCTIGVVIQFAMVSTFICWMVHILYIGVLVKFPFFGKKLQKKSKQIHIATVLAAIFLASIGPVVTLAHVGYFTARFPVVTCLPRNMDVLFFSIALPLTVLIGLVTVILMFLFRELRKVSIYV